MKSNSRMAITSLVYEQRANSGEQTPVMLQQSGVNGKPMTVKIF
jgi:hypothetical protein